jgi:serine O-acetyltransferase
VTTADEELVHRAWLALCAQASSGAEREPILAALLEKCVTQHGSFAASLTRAVAAIVFEEADQARAIAVIQAVYDEQPPIVAAAAADLGAFVARDPSCEGELDVLLNYKGFRALQCHRIAHELWTAGRRSLARFIQGRVAQSLAMDLHPGATIGRALFIDHGTGIVIGETAVVENNVSMLHSVTLGGTGKVAGDRHPKIREGVMIGAGAKILGNIEIGSYSKIAAGSVVLRSIPPHSTAAGVPASVVGHPREPQPFLEMDQDI